MRQNCFDGYFFKSVLNLDELIHFLIDSLG